MRKIEEKMLIALRNGLEFSCGNTRVEGRKVYLHNNLIAKLTNNAVIVDSCGWSTVTTKSRLNAILGYFCDNYISQKKGTWYMKGGVIFEDNMEVSRCN